jgi:hypothetical protein
MWFITYRLARDGKWHQFGHHQMRRWIKRAREWQYREMTAKEVADCDDRMVW